MRAEYKIPVAVLLAVSTEDIMQTSVVLVLSETPHDFDGTPDIVL